MSGGLSADGPWNEITFVNDAAPTKSSDGVFDRKSSYGIFDAIPEVPDTCVRDITVKRTDNPNAGWGMDLSFNCKGDIEMKVGPSTSSPQKTVTAELLRSADGDSDLLCPETVNEDNWLGGMTYGDSFNVSVSKCRVRPFCTRKITVTKVRGGSAGWDADARLFCKGGLEVNVSTIQNNRKTVTAELPDYAQSIWDHCPKIVKQGENTFKVQVDECTYAPPPPPPPPPASPASPPPPSSPPLPATLCPRTITITRTNLPREGTFAWQWVSHGWPHEDLSITCAGFEVKIGTSNDRQKTVTAGLPDQAHGGLCPRTFETRDYKFEAEVSDCKYPPPPSPPSPPPVPMCPRHITVTRTDRYACGGWYGWDDMRLDCAGDEVKIGNQVGHLQEFETTSKTVTAELPRTLAADGDLCLMNLPKDSDVLSKGDWPTRILHSTFAKFKVEMSGCVALSPPPSPPSPPLPLSPPPIPFCSREIAVTLMDVSQPRYYLHMLDFYCADGIRVYAGQFDSSGYNPKTNVRGKPSRTVAVQLPTAANRTFCPNIVDKNFLNNGDSIHASFKVQVGECPAPPSRPSPPPLPPSPPMCARAITVTRTDQNAGWILDLNFMCADGVKVKVGASHDPKKTINAMFLEHANGDPCPNVVNKDNWQMIGDSATYDDSFKVEVGECAIPPISPPPPPPVCKRDVNVTRMDADLGWGMNLRFDCAGGVEVKVGSTGQITATKYTPYKTVTAELPEIVSGDLCPKIVNKDNWLGGDTHDYSFKVEVGECK